MKVMLLTADSNGGYPVPAVRGGAVSTLVEHLVSENNAKQLCEMEIISLYDEEAAMMAKSRYQNIEFTWIRVPWILKILDRCVFNFIRIFLKRMKAISYKSPFSLLYYIFKSKRIVKNSDADKVVIENNVLLALIMKKNEIRGEWYYHFHNVPRIDAGCRKEFQKVSKFLCVSKYVAEQICKDDSAIGKVSHEKTVVLLNSVDTGLFKPINKNEIGLNAYRNKYGLKENDLIIVFAGRIAEEKGPDKVIEAMALLPDNVKCLIVGSCVSGTNVKTSFQTRITRMAEMYGNRVVFTGYIEQKLMPYIYNMADIAVLPSMWEEPAGLTMIEALACGIPVITTKSGGILEYVGEYGYTLNRDQQLVENIAKSVMAISERIYPSTKAVCWITDRFSTNQYLNRFIESIFVN